MAVADRRVEELRRPAAGRLALTSAGEQQRDAVAKEPYLSLSQAVDEPHCGGSTRYILYEESLGNALSAQAIVDRYGADAFRHYVVKYLHTTADSDFSEDRLISAHDGDLADQWGNLLRRSLALVARYFSNRIPEPGRSTLADSALRAAAERARDEQVEAFAGFDLNEAAAAPVRLLATANRYFDTEAPWTLGRSGERQRLASVLFFALEAVWKVAWLLSPIVPHASARVFLQIGAGAEETASARSFGWEAFAPGKIIAIGAPLFPKLRCAFTNSARELNARHP